MHVEMPLERFVDFYRMFTLGKLIQGLVHNLNGPLQNLGMDMEMMEHSLRSDTRIPDEISKSFLGRLQRMEGEFDHVNGLIRSASMRIDPEGDYQQCGTLKGFLEQEISFLHSNLYFKHNVQKDIRLPEDLPHLECLSRDILLSLCWLVQCIVEEMESGKTNLFIMESRSVSSTVEISLAVEGEMVGERYTDAVQGSPEGSLTIRDALGLTVSLALLRFHGGSAVCRREPTRFEMALVLPFSTPPE